MQLDYVFPLNLFLPDTELQRQKKIYDALQYDEPLEAFRECLRALSLHLGDRTMYSRNAR